MSALESMPPATREDMARLETLDRQLRILQEQVAVLLRRHDPASVFILIGSGLPQEKAVELLAAAAIRMALTDARA